MTTHTRCAAAHIEDPSACDGPADAVFVRDRFGGEAAGCVRHAAAMLRVIDGATVHAGSVPGAAIETFKRARRGAA